MIRYNESEFSLYDANFRNLAKRSSILNPDETSTPYGHLENLSQTTLSLLYEQKQVEAEELQVKLEEIREQDKYSRQAAINQGGHWKESHTRLENRLEQEANYDVRRSEVEAIDRRLKQFQKTEDERPLLPHGPRGTRKINPQTGTGRIDEQRVEPNKQGIPAINEPTSQYHGVTVVDYVSKIAKPWLQACAKKYRELVEAWDEKEVPEEERKSLKQVFVPWPSTPNGVALKKFKRTTKTNK